MKPRMVEIRLVEIRILALTDAPTKALSTIKKWQRTLDMTPDIIPGDKFKVKHVLIFTKNGNADRKK